MTGFIPIDKQKDITSFSMCNKVRRLIGAEKAGHTGTLDPMATGVLCVAIGGATKFIGLIPSHDKAYRARARLGLRTDTLDITGKVTEENTVSVTREQLISASEKYIGVISQLPPMYSAVSKDGVRLYELARKGIEIDREKREVEIYDLEISEFDGIEFTLNVSCSQGTYIRTLIDDIGAELGCGAVMTQLVRTRANGFSLEECFTLGDIEKAVGENRVNELITPVEKLFSRLEAVSVSEAQAKRFSNGGELSLDRIRFDFTDGLYRVCSPDGSFLGLGTASLDENLLKVRRLYQDG